MLNSNRCGFAVPIPVQHAVDITDLYYVPDTVRPIYFLSDREDLQAEFSIPPDMAETSVNAFL